MNPDGHSGISGDVRLGATLMGWLVVLLLIGGVFFLVLGVGLLFFAVATPSTRESREDSEMAREAT